MTQFHRSSFDIRILIITVHSTHFVDADPQLPVRAVFQQACAATRRQLVGACCYYLLQVVPARLRTVVHRSAVEGDSINWDTTPAIDAHTTTCSCSPCCPCPGTPGAAPANSQPPPPTHLGDSSEALPPEGSGRSPKLLKALGSRRGVLAALPPPPPALAPAALRSCCRPAQ